MTFLKLSWAVILFFLSSSVAYCWLEGPSVRDCRNDEFPSATSVYVSIQDEEGNEIYNSMCSGAIVEDPRFFVTSSHCLMAESDLLGPFSYLPPPLLEKYQTISKQKSKEKGKKVTGILKVRYFVDGIEAKFAISRLGRQSILLLESPTERVPAQLSFDHEFTQGTVCQAVGFSPQTEFEKLGIKKEQFRTIEDWQNFHLLRKKIFKNLKKRCGQTTYQADIGPESDISIFAGLHRGSDSVQPGDSGGPCYVKNKKNEWVIAGFNEFGDMKLDLNKEGKLQINHKEGEDTNNGMVLLRNNARTHFENLLKEVRKIKDAGAPDIDHEQFFGDKNPHIRIKRKEDWN